MTQIESIQQNINGAKLALNGARTINCKDEIQRAHVQSVIDFHLNELKKLRYSLNCAVKLNQQ